MQTKEQEVRDNGRITIVPEYRNVEADFWKMKYLEARIELANANRGIGRLVKKKKMWNDTARACKRAFDRGFKEGISTEK